MANEIMEIIVIGCFALAIIAWAIRSSGVNYQYDKEPWPTRLKKIKAHAVATGEFRDEGGIRYTEYLFEGRKIWRMDSIPALQTEIASPND